MFETRENNPAKIPTPEENIEACRQKVLASLERINFSEKMEEPILDRLVLMEKESRFNEDSRKIERGMSKILDLLEERYVTQYPQLHLSKEQRAEAQIAAILHDIGKSGPVGATPAEQEVIIKIFSQENIKDQNALVMNILADFFALDQMVEAKRSLENCGIGEQATMRQFWDKHAFWTRDILEEHSRGISKHVRIIAGSHHADHGINPYALPESELPLATNIIGTLEDYGEILGKKALMAMDQYEAFMRRGGFTHAAALELVRKNLVKYANDELMKLVLEAIDELGQKQEIFN